MFLGTLLFDKLARKNQRTGHGGSVVSCQAERSFRKPLSAGYRRFFHRCPHKVRVRIEFRNRCWRAFGLKPHRASTYTLSKDPLFVEKVRDVVGLYLSPPDRALVLSVDEKSQIQALERTQPVLPLRPGTVERRTADYERHGTTTLFAALDVQTGKVIGRCYPRHRAKEFRQFLDQIDAVVPAAQEVHLILDNYATHKSPAIHRWLLKHPRFHLHFIPTHSSWLNLVERWFALLTERQIKRAAHTSVRQLQEAIERFLEVSNTAPRPFVWTKTAEEILGKVARYAADTLRAHA